MCMIQFHFLFNSGKSIWRKKDDDEEDKEEVGGGGGETAQFPIQLRFWKSWNFSVLHNRNNFKPSLQLEDDG